MTGRPFRRRRPRDSHPPDGSSYELPDYAGYREAVREQYKSDPDLERRVARFAFDWQRDEIAYLRSVGLFDLAEMYAAEFHAMPTARWPREWEKEILRDRQRPNEDKYRESHSEPIRERNALYYKDHQSEFDDLRLSRPFVVIDSEGQDYETDTKLVGSDGRVIDVEIVDGQAIDKDGNPVEGVLYKDHGTYVWCASTDDRDKPPHILADPNSKGKDKRKLGVKTILDWLLSLPGKYDPVRINRKEQEGAIYVMYGSGYDITQLLAQMTLRTAHNVLRRVDYDDDGDEPLNAPEYWEEYAFSHIKGKWIDIWKLRDPDKPTKLKLEGGKWVETIDASEHIKIYDVIGYFQKKFEDVVDDMVKRKMADDYEKALISKMKARRGVFAKDPIEEITEYCLTECRLLSKQMGQIRKRPIRWICGRQAGMGRALSLTQSFRNERSRNISGNISHQSDLSEQQKWSHHAFVGGRIESLKQGYLKSGALYVYDVASCYPAAIVELPSLRPDQGAWKRLGAEDMRFDDLTELLGTDRKDFDGFHVPSPLEIPYSGESI